jgi:hypothetical protein
MVCRSDINTSIFTLSVKKKQIKIHYCFYFLFTSFRDPSEYLRTLYNFMTILYINEMKSTDLPVTSKTTRPFCSKYGVFVLNTSFYVHELRQMISKNHLISKILAIIN